MENVIINFDANTTELTKAIDILVKLGQVDEKTAAEFKKANQAYVERAKVTNETIKSAEKLGVATEQAAKKTTTAIDNSKKSISAMDSVLKSVAQGIAGAFAVQKIIAFGEASVQAFQEAEKNALLLKSAVSVNGGLQQDFEELIAQSEELQKVTIFSDDAIQRAQTAALQFGLTKDQVKALIPVITDFASATGKDLQEALDTVLQGVNGLGKGLKQYSVFIDENGTRQSRLAEITQQLTKKFDGQAVAVGETAGGAAAKYANEIDNLQESLGERLAPALNKIRGTVLETTEALLESVGLLQSSGFDDTFKRYKDLFKEKFATTSLDELRTKYEELVKTQDKVTGTGRTLVLAQKQAIIELLNSANGLTKVSKAEADALEQLSRVSKLTDKELQQLKKTFDKFNNIGSLDAIDAIDKEVERRAKARGKKQVDNTRKVADDEAKIRKELADKEFAQDEENLKKFVAARKEALVKQNLSSEDLEKQLTQLELQELELRLKNLQDYGKDTGDIEKQIADFRVKNYLDANKKIQDSNDEMFNAYLQALEDQEEAEKKAKEDEKELNERFAKDIESITKDIYSSLIQITNNYFDSRALKIQEDTDSILEAYDKQIEANEELHDRNKRGDREYENQKKKLLDERTAAEKKADKELRKIKHDQAVFNRDIAILNATLSTAQGVARAFADYPYPYDLVVAALVGALGAAEIAVAATTPIPSYAKGVEKITGKGTETSDEVPARLSVGERVVKASTNRKFFPILSAIHNERFDPETMNQLAKYTPETLKMLTKTDPQLLRELATMQPVFMKHIEQVRPMTFRADNLKEYRRVEITNVSHETTSNSIDEYGVARALDRGTHLKEGTIKQLAKEIGKEVKEKKNIGKSWR